MTGNKYKQALSVVLIDKDVRPESRVFGMAHR
jgi:hypothetical protein